MGGKNNLSSSPSRARLVSNIVPVVQGVVELVAAAGVTRFIFDFKRPLKLGAITRYKLTYVGEAGTVATTVDITLLRSENLSAPLEGPDMILRDTLNAIGALNTTPVDNTPVSPIDMHLIPEGKIQVAIQHVGGTPNSTYRLELFAEMDS